MKYPVKKDFVASVKGNISPLDFTLMVMIYDGKEPQRSIREVMKANCTPKNFEKAREKFQLSHVSFFKKTDY